MSLLSRDQILGASDLAHEDIPVPEWGGTVRIRSLSGAERDEYENSLVQQVGNKQVTNARNARAKLVAMAAVGEDGQPVFTKADVIKLGSKNSAALQRLFDAACRLSGFTDEDVKELEEGFGDGPSGPSTSGSPSPSASPSENSSAAPVPANSPSTWPTNGTPAPSARAVPTTTQH